MSKATLEFDLPDEREEFNTARRAGDLMCALYELEREFRNRWKYGDEEFITLEELRELFYNTLDEYDVRL